ncbi:MAG: WG repeat-containing protein [Deltaproteobacteria bacterium]|nr:WG repeat-containing protein [Deltaproteobacteria bacterium]
MQRTTCGFDSAREFSEGLAPLIVGGKFGFADQTGKLIIPASFSEARNFAEGLAPVGVGHREGYIDKTGKSMWQSGD